MAESNLDGHEELINNSGTLKITISASWQRRMSFWRLKHLLPDPLIARQSRDRYKIVPKMLVDGLEHPVLGLFLPFWSKYPFCFTNSM